MADYSELFSLDDPPAQQDVDMSSLEVAVEIPSAAQHDENDQNPLPFPEGPAEDMPSRVSYVEYLKSPIVTLVVSHGEDQALLTAHEALLTQSPWFAETCAKFSRDLAVCTLLYSPFPR
jgi:hypothetical protein